MSKGRKGQLGVGSLFRVCKQGGKREVLDECHVNKRRVETHGSSSGRFLMAELNLRSTSRRKASLSSQIPIPIGGRG